MFRDIPFNQLGKAGYNRGINRAHVNNIKRNFCPDMVQPAIVSLRDGKYWIIDHQHQSQAIYERNNNDPNTLIKCDVRTGLTYEQEAELYYKLNTGSRPLGFNDKLIGLIESKDPEALEFRATVEACGYTVDGRGANSLRAVKTAWKIFRKADGKDKLTQILKTTQACWPNNPNGAHLQIIHGLLLFLAYHGDEYKREYLVKALSPLDPKIVVNRATTFYKQMDSKAFTQPYCTYTTILNLYNTGKKNKLQPVAPGM